MRDELWFIEFGRGAPLPLTPPEESPADGEPMVPCAQGRVVMETTRPAPPHFATCSSYRRPLLSRTSNEVSISDAQSSSSGTTDHQQEQQQQQQYQQKQQQITGGKGTVGKSTIMPQSPASRPDDLSVTPWYLEDYPMTDVSSGPMGDRSSYPLYLYADSRDGKLDLNSTRNSSMESDLPKPATSMQRMVCMDLKSAMDLLDEMCPNVEPSPPQSLTPRTPRTPLTPYVSRIKRSRSKSSDNSSNYSNDRLSDRSSEITKDKDKKRPFLRKIGTSKTEDRPFFTKLTPRIIGKPYLEKIGPSKAIERPFLEKIGSSKTLDKFFFSMSRMDERKKEVKTETRANKVTKNHDHMENDVKPETDQVVVKENMEKVPKESIQKSPLVTSRSEEQKKPPYTSQTASTTFERRRSGKEFLLKMYSFETEDLDSVSTKGKEPLRGSSLDDVLDSGPSSLPTETSNDSNMEQTASRPELEIRPTSVTAELLKCRVTTSEEIISSSTTHVDLPSEANSWNNSPRKLRRTRKESATPIRRRVLQDSCEVLRSDTESTPNSPTKRPISSVSPDREIESKNSAEKGILSPAKTRKSTLDETKKNENMRRLTKYNQFEKRGISSDNLLAKDAFSFAPASRTITDDAGKTREISSEDSLARRSAHEYTKETFKQLQDKFKLQEIPTESYAAFKRRTRAAHGGISLHERLNLLPSESDAISKNVFRTKNVATVDSDATGIAEDKRETKSREPSQEGTIRSILKKQERIEHPSDQESDTNSSIRRPKRRIFHEPSQETMDLLTELLKVKSLLKTPSWEKDLDLEQKPVRMPKRILLTDKEFCLSVERENSVRRPSRIINSLETTEEGKVTSNQHKENQSNSETKLEQKTLGPALFEKKCLSLDYADEEKPQKPEIRAISLASARDLMCETEEADKNSNLMTCDFKSNSSDVFNSPSKETNKEEKEERVPEPTEQPKKPNHNHCAEVDTIIPVDQEMNSSKENVQEQTGDIYEIMSPQSTPFRAKKRLGKISVEETVKPENFTLGSKVDCQSVVAQKRTKCLPL